MSFYFNWMKPKLDCAIRDITNMHHKYTRYSNLTYIMNQHSYIFSLGSYEAWSYASDQLFIQKIQTSEKFHCDIGKAFSTLIRLEKDIHFKCITLWNKRSKQSLSASYSHVRKSVPPQLRLMGSL